MVLAVCSAAHSQFIPGARTPRNSPLKTENSALPSPTRARKLLESASGTGQCPPRGNSILSSTVTEPWIRRTHHGVGTGLAAGSARDKLGPDGGD
eukprot:1822078-Rhodomonas_salina.1